MAIARRPLSARLAACRPSLEARLTEQTAAAKLSAQLAGGLCRCANFFRTADDRITLRRNYHRIAPATLAGSPPLGLRGFAPRPLPAFRHDGGVTTVELGHRCRASYSEAAGAASKRWRAPTGPTPDCEVIRARRNAGIAQRAVNSSYAAALRRVCLSQEDEAFA